MRVQVVDPSAYTRAYDHALCAALAREGAAVELITSAFPYGEVPPPDGYAVREMFYRRSFGPAGSRVRRAGKLLEHVPDMLRYRRAAVGADVAHFQWLAVQSLDRHLLPRVPIVLTAHDLLPREPRPTQVGAQRRLYDAVDAVVTHSEYGRRVLVDELRVDPAKVRVIHHGAFDYLAELRGRIPPSCTRCSGRWSCSSAWCVRIRESTCCSMRGASCGPMRSCGSWGARGSTSSRSSRTRRAESAG